MFAPHKELFAYMPELRAIVELTEAAEKTAEDVVELIRGVPFHPAMRFAAQLQKAIELVHSERPEPSAPADVRNLRRHHSARAGDCFLREHENGVIFFEQQVFALQRLLVLHAANEHADALTDEQQRLLKLALMYVPGAVLGTDEDVQTASDYVADERWLRYFVGNGGFAAHGSLMHEMARAHRMYEVIAKSRCMRDHHDYCPIDEWLVEAHGMTFVEQQAFGFVMLAGSKLQSEEEPPVAIRPEYFDNTFHPRRVSTTSSPPSPPTATGSASNFAVRPRRRGGSPSRPPRSCAVPVSSRKTAPS